MIQQQSRCVFYRGVVKGVGSPLAITNHLAEFFIGSIVLDGDKNIAFPGSAAFGWLSNESDFSRFSSRGGKSLDFPDGRRPDVMRY